MLASCGYGDISTEFLWDNDCHFLYCNGGHAWPSIDPMPLLPSITYMDMLWHTYLMGTMHISQWGTPIGVDHPGLQPFVD